MKKLMIAAVAAAMIGGAFADEAALPAPKFNLVTNDVPLLTSQVLQFKTKASNWKSLNLNKGVKEFGKTIKNPVLAIDGVYYATTNGWVMFWWNKNEFASKKVAAPAFDVFQNEQAKKALAVYGGPFGQMYGDFQFDGWTLNEKGDAEATEAYASLKFGKDKKIDLTVKSIKDLTGSVKYSVKTFKASSKKSAQAQVDEYVKKLILKAQKVNKDVK